MWAAKYVAPWRCALLCCAVRCTTPVWAALLLHLALHSVQQESESVRQESDSVQQESDSVQQESDSVRQESDSVRQESFTGAHCSTVRPSSQPPNAARAAPRAAAGTRRAREVLSCLHVSLIGYLSL